MSPDDSVDHSSVLFTNRAMAYIKLGEHEAALLDAEEALKLNKKHPRSWCRQGLCKLAFNHSKNALAFLQNFVGLYRSGIQ